MKDRWCVRCGRTTPTPYTLKALQWRRKAGLPIRSVLDLGCGNGRNLRAFQITGGARRLVGFDLCTERAKSLCRAHICKAVKLVNGVLGETEPPKGKFDIVLLNYSLMFLDEASRSTLARQVSERLAPSGWVVIEMYPAKDSECPDEYMCSEALWKFSYAAVPTIGSSPWGCPGVVRSSNLRMIIQAAEKTKGTP